VTRQLLATRGYEKTSIDEILRRARVTRGALYHHFAGKQELFRAVFEQVEGEVTQKVAAAGAAEDGPADRRLHAGCAAMLDATLTRDVQRIGLLDAPSVLGWERWYEIHAAHGLGLMRAALAEAMEDGSIAPQPIEPLSHVLLGALNQAALLIARSDDVEKARAELGTTVDLILDGLRPRE